MSTHHPVYISVCNRATVMVNGTDRCEGCGALLSTTPALSWWFHVLCLSCAEAFALDLMSEIQALHRAGMTPEQEAAEEAWARHLADNLEGA